MTKHVAPALVIGGGGGNGVSIARNLGARGIPVYCVTSNPNEVTCYSKYCTGAAIIPGVESDPACLLRMLHQFAQHITEPCVLFPTTDTAVLTLASIQSEIAPHVTSIPDHTVAETMVIKTKFYQSLHEHGIPHPRTLNPQYTPIETITRQLNFPVYIRPAQTLLFVAHFSGKGFVAHNIHELRNYLHRVAEVQLEVMVQEVIPGPTTNGFGMSGYMDRHGRVLAFYAVQKLRQPSMFANASVNVTVPRAQLKGFDTIILDYLRRMQYRGIFGTEMKWDARDRCFKFLEVNARSMGGNYLGVACGANHVLAAYQNALTMPVEPTDRYESGIHYLELVYDLTAILQLAWRHHEWRPNLRPYTHPHLFNFLRRGDTRPFLKDVATFVQRVRAHISTNA